MTSQIKTYITTTNLYKPIINQRRVIQDMCVDALLTPGVSEFLSLDGIIAPEWSNPEQLTEYKGVPVQSVKTRDLANYNKKDVWNTHKKCPVINYTVKRGKRDADNEHLSLYENMKIETPCVILDGDILMYNNGNLRTFRNTLIRNNLPSHCICASHAIFLQNHNDVSKIMTTKMDYEAIHPTVQQIRDEYFRCSTHFSRAMHHSMTTYAIVNAE